MTHDPARTRAVTEEKHGGWVLPIGPPTELYALRREVAELRRERDDLTNQVNHADGIITSLLWNTPCDLCGEALHDDTAEMYDTTRPDYPSVTCHSSCGLARGLEVA